MDGEQRREEILSLLVKNGTKPCSGSAMAKEFHVSRQVIVQDIALLRATNKNIISTTKGYLLYEEEVGRAKRVFQVQHDGAQMENELHCIVDHGGKVLDVVVEHKVYGMISVDLILSSRQDVNQFIELLHTRNASPLMGLTQGVHYHTVEAENEEILDAIEKDLKKNGYLISK